MKILVIYPSGFSTLGGYSIVTKCLHKVLQKSEHDYISIVCDEIYEDNSDYYISLKHQTKLTRFILSLFTPYPALIYKYYRAKVEIQKILDEHSEYKIWLDDNVFGFLFRSYSERIVVQRNHDLLWYSYRNLNKGNMLKRAAWSLELSRLSVYEKSIYSNESLQIFLTDDDRAWAVERFPSIKFSNILSFYVQDLLPVHFSKELRRNLLFIGRIDDKKGNSLLWFIDNVLPQLNSDIQLVIVGKNDSRIDFGRDRVIELGFVEDVRNLESESFAYINPQKHCSGIQVKNLYMIQSGLPVCISSESAKGLKGIELFNVCATSLEWVESINDLFVQQVVFEPNRLQTYGKNYFKKNIKALLNDLQ